MKPLHQKFQLSVHLIMGLQPSREPLIRVANVFAFCLLLLIKVASIHAQNFGAGNVQNPNTLWDQPKRYAVIDLKSPDVPLFVNNKGVVAGSHWTWASGKISYLPKDTYIVAFNDNGNFINYPEKDPAGDYGSGDPNYDFNYPYLPHGEDGGDAWVTLNPPGRKSNGYGDHGTAFALNNHDKIGGEGVWDNIQRPDDMWDATGTESDSNQVYGDMWGDLYSKLYYGAKADYYVDPSMPLEVFTYGRVYRLSDNGTPLVRVLLTFEPSEPTALEWGTTGYEAKYYIGDQMTASFSGCLINSDNTSPTGFIPCDINAKDEVVGTDRATGHMTLQGSLGQFDLGPGWPIRVNNAQTPVYAGGSFAEQWTPQVLTCGGISNLRLPTMKYATDIFDDLVPSGWSGMQVNDINDAGWVVGTAGYNASPQDDSVPADTRNILLLPCEFRLLNGDAAAGHTDGIDVFGNTPGFYNEGYLKPDFADILPSIYSGMGTYKLGVVNFGKYASNGSVYSLLVEAYVAPSNMPTMYTWHRSYQSCSVNVTWHNDQWRVSRDGSPLSDPDDEKGATGDKISTPSAMNMLYYYDAPGVDLANTPCLVGDYKYTQYDFTYTLTLTVGSSSTTRVLHVGQFVVARRGYITGNPSTDWQIQKNVVSTTDIPPCTVQASQIDAIVGGTPTILIDSDVPTPSP